MTPDEWKTIAEFGVLVLGISLFSPRIAFVMMAGIALSAIIGRGGDVWNIFNSKGA